MEDHYNKNLLECRLHVLLLFSHVSGEGKLVFYSLTLVCVVALELRSVSVVLLVICHQK